MLLGIDPKVDYAFKLLLGREETKALLAGRQIGMIQMLQRMLGQPEASTDELGKLSLEELDRMVIDLERQFRATRS